MPPEWLPESLAKCGEWTWRKLASDYTTKWQGKSGKKFSNARQWLHIQAYENPPHYIASLSDSKQAMVILMQKLAYLTLESIPSQKPKKTTEERWMPANSTEFEWFREAFCENCIHDQNQDCSLIRKAVENTDKPECGPKQWKMRPEDSRPYCTKFKANIEKEKADEVSLEKN